jgi:hypothetical protein
MARLMWYTNDAPDQGKELYEGHRVIKIWEYDVEKDQVIAGTEKLLLMGELTFRKNPSGLKLRTFISATTSII